MKETYNFHEGQECLSQCPTSQWYASSDETVVTKPTISEASVAANNLRKVEAGVKEKPKPRITTKPQIVALKHLQKVSKNLESRAYRRQQQKLGWERVSRKRGRWVWRVRWVHWVRATSLLHDQVSQSASQAKVEWALPHRTRSSPGGLSKSEFLTLGPSPSLLCELQKFSNCLSFSWF